MRTLFRWGFFFLAGGGLGKILVPPYENPRPPPPPVPPLLKKILATPLLPNQGIIPMFVPFILYGALNEPPREKDMPPISGIGYHNIGNRKKERKKNRPSDGLSPSSSVASSLVLGGGGQDPEMYRRKLYVIARASEASERLRNIYSGLKIHLHTYTIIAVSFNYLLYGAINDIILTKH